MFRGEKTGGEYISPTLSDRVKVVNLLNLRVLTLLHDIVPHFRLLIDIVQLKTTFIAIHLLSRYCIINHNYKLINTTIFQPENIPSLSVEVYNI